MTLDKDGTVQAVALTDGSATLTGGNLNSVNIGASTAGTGAFTTLSASTHITDGTASIASGAITGVTSITVDGVTVGAAGDAITSDRRLKENVRNITDPLEHLAALRGVRYTWRADAFGASSRANSSDVGFIAQELEEIFPELVVDGATGYKAVLYNGIIPVLVEGVKAQHAHTKAQQTRIDSQQTRIDSLESQVASLEAAAKIQEQTIRELLTTLENRGLWASGRFAS